MKLHEEHGLVEPESELLGPGPGPAVPGSGSCSVGQQVFEHLLVALRDLGWLRVEQVSLAGHQQPALRRSEAVFETFPKLRRALSSR